MAAVLLLMWSALASLGLLWWVLHWDRSRDCWNLHAEIQRAESKVRRR